MALSQKNEKTGNIILRVLITILTFGIVIFLIFRNLDDFIEAFRRLPLTLMLILIVFAFLSRVAKTIRWFILIKAVEPGVIFKDIFKLSFVGLFTTNVLPSTIGGDLVKFSVGVQTGLDSAHLAASLILDRLVGMVTMATFLPFGIVPILQMNVSQADFTNNSLLGLIPNLWRKSLSLLDRTWKSLHLWFKKPSCLIGAVILSYLHMFLTFSIVFLILVGLSDPVPWWIVGGLWVFVYFITLVPISINGFGLQEISLSFVFHSLAGISVTNSLVLAIIIRLIFIIASLPGALFLPKIIPMKPIKGTLNDEL